MTRRQQYRFLIAASIAVAWIAFGIYAALATIEAGAPPINQQSAFFQTLYLPYTLTRMLGLPMQQSLGFAGGLLALVVLWIVVTVAIWAVMEVVAMLLLRRRAGSR
jgi:hypothetical protein